jgi:hypothetical protein
MFKQMMFLQKYKENQNFGPYMIWTERAFVTQLFGNAGISI